MSSQNSPHTSDGSEPAQKFFKDFAFDEIQMPEIQAFGQDESGPGVQCARRKSSAWNDVGIDTRKPELNSKEMSEGKGFTARPPSKATSKKKKRKELKKAQHWPRKRPRNVPPRPDLEKASEKKSLLARSSKRSLNPSHTPQQVSSSALRTKQNMRPSVGPDEVLEAQSGRFHIFSSSAEPDEKSSSDRQRASVRPTRAGRNAILLAELGFSSMDERATPPRGDEVKLESYEPLTKRAPTEPMLSSSTDTEDAVRRRRNSRSQLRRKITSSSSSRDEAVLSSERNHQPAVLRPTFTGSSEKDDTSSGQQTRELPNSFTERGRDTNKKTTTAREYLNEDYRFRAKRRRTELEGKDARAKHGAHAKNAAHETSPESCEGLEPNGLLGLRRKRNLRQTASWNSDRKTRIIESGSILQEDGKAAVFKTSVKAKATEKKHNILSNVLGDDNLTRTGQQPTRMKESSQEPSNQSRKEDLVGDKVLGEPDEGNGSDNSAIQERGTTDDLNPAVVKELERTRCLECSELSEGEKMVLCDACFTGCHIFCMRPKRRSVPLGVWLCPDCHEAARRHGVHVSLMFQLRWHLQCFECTTRNDPDIKLDCDKACADCKIAFHSACLRMYRKVSASDIKDPKWKCAACRQTSNSALAVHKGGRDSMHKETNVAQAPGNERLYRDDRDDVIPKSVDAKKVSARGEPFEPREAKEFRKRSRRARKGKLLGQSKEPPTRRKFEAEDPSKTVPSETKSGFEKFVCPPDSSRMPSNEPNNDARAARATSPLEDIMVQEEVLDGSGFSCISVPQPRDSSVELAESSQPKARGLTALFRSPVGEKKGVSELFKQRKPSTSPASMDMNYRGRRGISSRGGKRQLGFDRLRPNKSLEENLGNKQKRLEENLGNKQKRLEENLGNNQRRKCIRSDRVKAGFGEGHAYHGKGLFEESVDSASLSKDEEVLDGGHAT